jgi:hypothetical protein
MTNAANVTLNLRVRTLIAVCLSGVEPEGNAPRSGGL